MTECSGDRLGQVLYEMPTGTVDGAGRQVEVVNRMNTTVWEYLHQGTCPCTVP